MRKFIILSTIILLCGCRTEVSQPIQTTPPVVSKEQAIQRAAIFLLIMRGNPWGKKELTAEIEYLKYLTDLKH